jgi:uncharacterized FlaG/YvyC family protein
MMDGSTHLGDSIFPVSSCAVTEMRVTNDQRQRREEGKKRQKKDQRPVRSLEATVDILNKTVAAMNKQIVFTLEQDGARRVVVVTEKHSNRIIKKVNGDELQNADRISDLLGVFIDKDG